MEKRYNYKNYMIVINQSLLGHYYWEAICDNPLRESYTSKQNAKTEDEALFDARHKIDEKNEKYGYI